MRQRPNVQPSSFFSKALGRVLKFKATTHAIRCIDKAGDIDHWLLKSPNSLILNPQAIALKKKIKRLRARDAGDTGALTPPGPIGTVPNAVGA